MYGLDIAESEDPTMLVAAIDRTRAWGDGLEADVGDGNGVYAQTVRDWVSLSRGALTATGVEESWTPGGDVTVELHLANGSAHTLRPRNLSDWIDLGILCDLDRLSAPAGIRYVASETDSQIVVVAALRPREIAALRRAGQTLVDACRAGRIVDRQFGDEQGAVDQLAP